MGAVPKYRISRRHRHQRRRGLLRQLKLKKNADQSAAPQHKRGLVAAMFSQMGLEFKKLITR